METPREYLKAGLMTSQMAVASVGSTAKLKESPMTSQMAIQIPCWMGISKISKMASRVVRKAISMVGFVVFVTVQILHLMGLGCDGRIYSFLRKEPESG
jgi:hypothetical protein